MGKLAELRPRESCSIYCPVKKGDVEVTKWRTGNDYVIICQEPWVNINVFVPRMSPYQKGSLEAVRKPCGYDRRCDILNGIFMGEKNSKDGEKSMKEDIKKMLGNMKLNRRTSSLVKSAMGRLRRGEYLMMDYLLGIAVEEAPSEDKVSVVSISERIRQLYTLRYPMDSKAINPR